MNRNSHIFTGPTSFLGGVAAEAQLAGFERNTHKNSIEAEMPSFAATEDLPPVPNAESFRGTSKSNTLKTQVRSSLSQRDIIETKANLQFTKSATTSNHAEKSDLDRGSAPHAKKAETKTKESAPTVRSVPTPTQYPKVLTTDQLAKIKTSILVSKTSPNDISQATKILKQADVSRAAIPPKQLAIKPDKKPESQIQNARPLNRAAAPPASDSQLIRDNTNLLQKNRPVAHPPQPEALSPRANVHIGTLEIQIEAPRIVPHATRRETSNYKSNIFSRMNIRGR